MTSQVGLLIPASPSPPDLDLDMSWRVGLLVPSPNSVMEVDFYRSLPHDTTLHTGRMYMRDFTPGSVEHMLDQFVVPAAEALGTVVPHLVVFGSTRAHLRRGIDCDREICRRIATVTGAQVVSVAESVSQALRDTHANRVAVVTPYTDDVNERLRAAFAADGIQVSALHGMGLSDAEAASVTPESIYSFVQTRIGATVRGDALYLACTNYHAMSALSLLRVTYDVPIVTTNLATLQAVKRKLHTLRDRGLAAAAARRA